MGGCVEASTVPCASLNLYSRGRKSSSGEATVSRGKLIRYSRGRKSCPGGGYCIEKEIDQIQ